MSTDQTFVPLSPPTMSTRTRECPECGAEVSHARGLLLDHDIQRVRNVGTREKPVAVAESTGVTCPGSGTPIAGVR